MILKAKHHFILYPFFQRYGNWLIERHFGQIVIENSFRENEKSILLLMNHFSWWDGFIASYLNTHHFHRKFYFMMLEEQLRKYWFFNYTGGYSVRKRSRSIIESLEYTIEILDKPGTLVLVFPQGQIESHHVQRITFQKGIEYLFKNITPSVETLFAAVFIDYFSSRKPGLFIYVTSYERKNPMLKVAEDIYNRFYYSCIKKQMMRGKV